MWQCQVDPRIKGGMRRAPSRGEIVSVLDLGAGGAAVRFLLFVSCFFFLFFLNHALHVRVFMETLWLTEMERMRSKPKWEIRVVSPTLGWQSWNSCDSPSGWSWAKLSYKNKTPSSTWTRNDTSQYGIVEPVWNRTLDYHNLQQLRTELLILQWLHTALHILCNSE